MNSKSDEIRKKKFIVDRMYNRLSHWLRILGYDTHYNPHFTDFDYIKLAHEENRILITRDEDLKRRAKKAGVTVVTIDAPTIEERLVKLAKEVGITLSLPIKTLPRCSICNAKIEQVERNDIIEKLEKQTIQNCTEFWICKNTDCRKIYWKGSHWQKIAKSLIVCNQILSNEF